MTVARGWQMLAASGEVVVEVVPVEQVNRAQFKQTKVA
jgi:hypothetical protein